MKTTRFNAATRGLVEAAKGMIRRNQVENALKSNELDAEAKLLALNDQKNFLVKAIATGEAGKLRENLQALADLIQEEKALEASKNLSSEILAVLDEEVEVEQESK